MSLIQELKEGTLKITVNDDGTESIERRPPTSLALRAANALTATINQLEGLSRAYNSLEVQFKKLEELYEKCSMVQEPVAEAGVNSVRPVHGNAEDSATKSET
jgi:hypothetical protein